MLSPATLKFLKDLKKNNNKPWFEKNRKVYEDAKADLTKNKQTKKNQKNKKDVSIKNIVA